MTKINYIVFHASLKLVLLAKGWMVHNTSTEDVLFECILALIVLNCTEFFTQSIVTNYIEEREFQWRD